MPRFKIPKFRAPIIQYLEIIPQTLWERFTGQEPRYKLRIKRAEPEKFNCRCELKVII